MIGRTISHYRIVSQLGSGGMGVVYEAEDTRLGRHVALKLLSPDACCDAVAMDRFLREARIVSSLSHPHICTLHDIGEQDGQQFMVMELLDGESLKSRIARGPMPIDEVLDIGTQIADALDSAHAAGVVHRDVKPANLFVTRGGLAKVLDFGVAKLAESAAPDRPDLEQTLAVSDMTTAGSAIGTVAYMSPEQARGQDIDARSDIFSLGEVLYEMVTGRQAFPGATPAVVFEGILTKQPPLPSEINAEVPPEFDRIVAKALEKDRETRYQSAAELRADLKRLKRETESGVARATGVFPPAGGPRAAIGPNEPLPAAVPVPPSRRLVWMAAPLVTLAVIAGVTLWQSQQAPALSSRDTVVLADFRNRTGDTMFDDTLSEALAVQLRQSPFLNLLSEQQVQGTLRLMNRDPMEPLTPEIAREVCVRSSAKAMLGGTIANIGNRYLLTLSAQECGSGQVLAEEQIDAEGKEEVITALGRAAASFREKLGESLASVQRYDQNIEQATTGSLEALKAYSQGMTARRTQGDFESVPFFRRAVELDPEFALAHARLGTVLSNLGQTPEAEDAARRAFELREKVSERERFYIEARFYHTVERNIDKAVEAYRLLLATYPEDYAAQTNLGSIYRQLGRHSEAIHHLEEAVRLNPMQPLGHINLGGTYMDEGRFDDARREFEEALKLQESLSARTELIVVGTLANDGALASRHLAEAKTPRGEGDLLATRAQVALYKGQARESARLTEELFTVVRDQNRLGTAAEGFVGFALNQALVGHTAQARVEIERLLKAGPLGDGALDEMVALGALLGDRRMIDQYLEASIKQLQATARADDIPKVSRGMRAIAALGRGDYQQAYDLGISNGFDFPQRNTLFMAGIAALRMERWDDAAKVLETFLAFGPRLRLSPSRAVGRIMLARAHAGAGRIADARRRYEEAFDLWKDADADLPLLLAAKREYERLTSLS